MTVKTAYARIDALIKARDLDAAGQALVQAAERHGQDIRYYRRAFRIARLRKDVPAAAVAAEHLVALGGASASVMAELPKLRLKLGDVQGAREVAGDADDLTRDVLDAVISAEAGDEVAMREALLRVELGRGNRIRRGPLATVLGELPTVMASPLPEGRHDLSALDGVLPPPEQLRRELIAEDDAADVIISPEGDSDTFVVVFTGLRDRMQFPLSVFDHFLSAEGIGAVYLRDFDRLLYWKGVRTWGGSEVMLERIRELADGRRLVIIGGSAGGFGAIHWGIELGADRVVTFAPPTNLENEFRERINDGRAKLMAKRLHRVIPPECRNLANHITAAGGSVPIHVVYGTQNVIDAGHALNLAGLPGVHLHPEPTATHSLLNTLITSGNFQRILAELVGLETGGVGEGGDSGAMARHLAEQRQAAFENS